MAEIKNFDKYRKKKTHKKFFIRLLIFIIICSIGFSIYIFRKSPFISSVKNFFTNGIIELKKGDGYPVYLPGGTSLDLKNDGNDVILLTDTDLIFYNSTGLLIRQIKHGAENPKIDTANNKVLVFDRGGKTISVESKTKTLFSKTCDKKIITASISDNGYVAVVTESGRYMSELTVYDIDRDNQIFAWWTTEQTICDVDFSNDNKKIAVASIGTSNGQIASSITSFYLDSEQPSFKVDFIDTLIINVTFKDKNNITAIGDNKLISINSEGAVLNQADFSNEEFIGYTNPKGKYSVLLLKDFTRNNNYFVRIFDSYGKLIAEKSYSEEIDKVSCDNSRVIASSQKTLKVIDMTGKELSSIDTDTAIYKVIQTGSDAYVLGTDKILSFSLK